MSVEKFSPPKRVQQNWFRKAILPTGDSCQNRRPWATGHVEASSWMVFVRFHALCERWIIFSIFTTSIHVSSTVYKKRWYWVEHCWHWNLRENLKRVDPVDPTAAARCRSNQDFWCQGITVYNGIAMDNLQPDFFSPCRYNQKMLPEKVKIQVLRAFSLNQRGLGADNIGLVRNTKGGGSKGDGRNRGSKQNAMGQSGEILVTLRRWRRWMFWSSVWNPPSVFHEFLRQNHPDLRKQKQRETNPEGASAAEEICNIY